MKRVSFLTKLSKNLPTKRLSTFARVTPWTGSSRTGSTAGGVGAGDELELDSSGCWGAVEKSA